MNDLEDIKRRLDVLEKLVLKRAAEVSAIELKILDHARQYARLTKLGYSVDEQGYRVRRGQQDTAELAGWHLQEMRRLAVELLAAETG